MPEASVHRKFVSSFALIHTNYWLLRTGFRPNTPIRVDLDNGHSPIVTTISMKLGGICSTKINYRAKLSPVAFDRNRVGRSSSIVVGVAVLPQPYFETVILW